ncbi:hypothetical protein ACLOJK_007349 [Asimina triloba]
MATATATGSAHGQEESGVGRQMEMELLTEGGSRGTARGRQGRRIRGGEAGEMREGGGDGENRTTRISEEDNDTTAPARIGENRIADRR